MKVCLILSLVIILEKVICQDLPVEERMPKFYSQILFRGGQNGYHSFRIPAIVKAPNGNLVAICEGRKNGNRDYGDINVVSRISTDNGITWSSIIDIQGQGSGSWQNPTVVVDLDINRIWLFMSWNSESHMQFRFNRMDKNLQTYHLKSYSAVTQTIDEWGERKVYLAFSDDNGLSWSQPEDLTSSLVPPAYTFDAIGPGTGIQTIYKNKGRLIIPAIGRNIFSDNHGKKWEFELLPNRGPDGSVIEPSTSEGTIIELENGTLMRNDRPEGLLCERSQPKSRKRRLVSYGQIGGSWTPWTSHPQLFDPCCEASVLRYTRSVPSRILFLNPASTIERGKMNIRISYDDGKSWPIARKLPKVPGFGPRTKFGGYSSLAKTKDQMVGALVEVNEDASNISSSLISHRSIVFYKFNLPWILNGRTEPAQ